MLRGRYFYDSSTITRVLNDGTGHHLTSPHTLTSLISVRVKQPLIAAFIFQLFFSEHPFNSLISPRYLFSELIFNYRPEGGRTPHFHFRVLGCCWMSLLTAVSESAVLCQQNGLFTELLEELKFQSFARCENKYLTYRSRVYLKVFPTEWSPSLSQQ